MKENEPIGKLEEILSSFDLPPQRKRSMTKANIEWLQKHLQSKNLDHPLYVKAKALIDAILKNKLYQF